MATDMRCPFDCGYSTGEHSEPVAIAYFNAHMLKHKQPKAQQSASRQSGPKLDRPMIEAGASMEEWNLFTRKWKIFKDGSHIDDKDASHHLFQCADGQLGDALLKTDPDIVSKDVDAVLQAMKKLSVIPIATGILRAELLEMKQLRDEPFRKFASRVRGKAEICEYTIDVTCSCTRINNVNFTDHIMRDVLLAGIYDADIRREMFGIDQLLQKSINEVIAMVEKKEMARDAHCAVSTSAISSMKQLQKKKVHNAAADKQSQNSNDAEKGKQVPCPKCKKSYFLYREGKFGWNSKPFNMCRECFRTQRRTKPSEQNAMSEQPQAADVGIITSDIFAIGSEIRSSDGGPSTKPPATRKNRRRQRHANVNSATAHNIRMDHHVFSEGEWRRAKFMDHPTWPTQLSVRRKDYADFSRPCPQIPSIIKLSAKMDTCAQSCLWSKKEFLAAGFKEEDLIPVSLGLKGANKSSIKIDGAILARLAVTVAGKVHNCATMVYISPSCDGFFMSLKSMWDLDLFQTFKVVPSSDGDIMACTKQDSTPAPSQHKSITCTCSPRTKPKRPNKLPFPAIPENNAKMEKWIKDYFETSTFNICSEQPLPKMSGPPVEIHLKDGAVPYKAQTAISIPIHWQKPVKELYAKDLALGVLEPSPTNEDNEWCHREVYIAKSSGEPRRTVDYKPGLNRWVKRDAYATESPFHVVRRIPNNTWKTVTDAWNGYHLVPLHPASKKYTTFISMEGKFQYTRCPQGASFAGDAYNRRHANITAEFPRKETVVDDTCLYDESSNLEQHWWRTIDYLILCGQNGIILNPDKFQFARKTVDFAGFRVSDSSIEPLPKYTDAIRDFPTPKSTTDIRSWFGLVNQLANYAQLRDMMRPFREFLSPKTPFTWNAELQRLFENSKVAIIDAIKYGVTIYDPKRVTCLRTDWSNLGIGYHLSQKHCDCESGLPGCCENGWQVTLAGSRFLIGPEQRYVAIEGEALAIAWALEQTRYFTLGCENLIVATDHKPLVTLFGDKDLNRIPNPRIFRLKQRTLGWSFQVIYLAGNTNLAADAVSRHPSPNIEETAEANLISAGADALSQRPSPNGELSEGDFAEIALVANKDWKASTCKPILWSEIELETAADPTLCSLVSTIRQGFPEKASDLSHELAPYWSIRNQLDIEDNVVWYDGRIVVPVTLRDRALDVLHSAHQGVSGMLNRARTILYWPGISNDIQRIRNSCTVCCRNAPSQAPLPAAVPECPETPFEAVFADFFEKSGHHYLVAGDRLSGWVEVYASPVGSSKAGARGLISHLRTLFTTFGIPMNLSSDGGPEFDATATKEFLSLWGVHHRESSAYNPQSNGRAEVAVKKVKRLLETCVGPNGSLNNDKFMRGMLQLRNTPDPECKLSPAQVLFGRPLRDAFSFMNSCPKFKNPAIQPLWRDAWVAKENALRTRYARSVERLNSHVRQLPQLNTGDKVFIQNQNGPHPTKWDRSGVVLENLGHDQYRVKVHGSGRVTIRNRRFLRQFTLPSTSVTQHYDRSPMITEDQVSFAPETMPYASAPDTLLESSVDQPSVSPSPSLTPLASAESSADQQPLVSPSPPITPSASAESSADQPLSQSTPFPLAPTKRGRGRPPKMKHFRGTPWQQMSSPPGQQSLVGPSSPSLSPGLPEPSAVTSRPVRTRNVPKRYDASTGI